MRSILHALVLLPTIAMTVGTAVSQTEISGPGPHVITEPGDYVVLGTVGAIVVDANDVQIDLTQGTVVGGGGLFGALTVGIDITDQFNVHIAGNGTGTVRNSGLGIRLQGGGGHHVNGVIVRDNFVQLSGFFQHVPLSGDGIAVVSSANNHINGNTLVSNEAIGIEVSGGSGHRINGNTSSNNGPLFFSFAPAAGGAFLRDTSGNTLNGNTLSSNSQFGMALVSSDGNTITDSTANGNRRILNFFQVSPMPGITLIDSDNNVVRGNTANDNSIGIEIGGGSDSNLIQGNMTTNNLVSGPFGTPGTAHGGGQVGSGISLSPGGLSFFPVFSVWPPAQDNTVRGNFSFGNASFDMADGNLNCGTNTWRGNTFDTADKTCIK